MRQIDCKDLGCCDVIITAADDAELKARLFEHARSEHPDAMKNMAPDAVKAVEQKIAQLTRSV